VAQTTKHYEVVPNGQVFEVVNRSEEVIVCYTRWRCNADMVCSALNAFAATHKPTVDDVNRRCAELIHAADDKLTFGELRQKLISEFGEELFEQARTVFGS
jgi:hypothetical protein